MGLGRRIISDLWIDLNGSYKFESTKKGLWAEPFWNSALCQWNSDALTFPNCPSKNIHRTIWCWVSHNRRKIAKWTEKVLKGLFDEGTIRSFLRRAFPQSRSGTWESKAGSATLDSFLHYFVWFLYFMRGSQTRGKNRSYEIALTHLLVDSGKSKGRRGHLHPVRWSSGFREKRLFPSQILSFLMQLSIGQIRDPINLFTISIWFWERTLLSQESSPFLCFSSAFQFLRFWSRHRSICEPPFPAIQWLPDRGESKPRRGPAMSHWDPYINNCETQFAFVPSDIEFLMKIL